MVTDLNASNPTAEVMAKHDRTCLVLNGACHLVQHSLPVRTAEQEKCPVSTSCVE
jgi:hypothetical protein